MGETRSCKSWRGVWVLIYVSRSDFSHLKNKIISASWWVLDSGGTKHGSEETKHRNPHGVHSRRGECCTDLDVILQARLQQYVNRELPDVQAGFRKGRGTRDRIANIRWIMEKAREFQKNIYFCFTDYAKPFDCVDHNKLWKILREMGIPDHLTCLLRNLYAGQEAAVRTGYGTTDWFQIGKEVPQGCILSPCLFNLYAVYMMRNAGLEEA